MRWLSPRIMFAVVSLGFGLSAGAQPINDLCTGALPAGIGALQGSTVGAIANGASSCGLSNAAADVYYRFIAPATCQFEIQTCDATDYDTVVSIHSACPATTSNQLVCSNDGCSTSRSRAVLNATRGTSYFVRVSGFQGATGDFTLIIRQLGRPANDTCAAAQPISGAFGQIAGDTTCAMAEGSQTCGHTDSTGSPNRYYLWTAPAEGRVTFDTCAGASFRTFLSASTHCPHTNLNLVGCNTSACDGRSMMNFGVVRGATYLIRVGGIEGERGTYTLAWTFSPTQFTPHDGCGEAQPIGLGSVRGSTAAASHSSEVSCVAGKGAWPDVFYRFRSPVEAMVTISTCSPATTIDTKLSVHSACPVSSGNTIVCSDNACGTASSVTFPARPGLDYFVRIAGFSSGGGEFVLTASAEVEAIVFDPSTWGEYYLLRDNLHIWDFREYAIDMGAHMAAMTSFSEAQFVNKSVVQAGNVVRNAAFGLSDELIEGLMDWDTRESVDFTFFFHGQPDNFNGGEDYCHILDPISGLWNDYPGTAVPTVHGVAESGAELLWTERNPANGHYYAIFEASSWRGADARARAMGGKLVTINDADENEWVRNLFGDVSNGRQLWIGLSDASIEGLYGWTDGSGVQYSNFAPGEPNNFAGDEDYVELIPATGQWNDVPNLQVASPNHGVVEFTLPHVISVVHGPGGCGTYALLSASNLYPAAFAGSELYGQLLSIHSAEENEFIRSAFAATGGGRRIWLVASDAADEGNFEWLDRTWFKYSNFAPGEPDNGRGAGEQDFVVMNPNGTWSDVSTLDPGPYFGVLRLYCECDWDASGARNSQDFFDFLTAFFADQADINCDGETNSQDFFDFLSCFFTGCGVG